MSWAFLILAGLFEVGWVAALQASKGLTRLGPLLLASALLMASMAFLAFSLRGVPLGVAYAVWTGIGAAGAIVVEAAHTGIAPSAVRIACVALIVLGILGLKASA
jgi:quaternary ammonium compound-resistance protein SugE